MAFTAKDVQALREATGIGMMECKKALQETDGDMEKAVIYLREKGLAAAAKKSSRIAAEGMVYTNVSDSGVGVMVEVNSETDFVAKNEDFQNFVKDVAAVIGAEAPKDVDDLLTKKLGAFTVKEALNEKVLVIGENIKIRRFERYDDCYSVDYTHMGGKIGVLVGMEVSEELRSNPTVKEVGRDVAMQIAAMRPGYLKPEDVDAQTIEQEKEILLVQVKQEGKPDNVAERIVAGKISKFYEENCLLNQAFVKDGKLTVGKYVEQKAKELGGKLSVIKFARFEKGEGLEKRTDNLAAEVAGMIK